MLVLLCDGCGGEIPPSFKNYSPDRRHFCKDCQPLVNRRQYQKGDALSQRELEVLALIVEGLSNQEIAQQLVVTIETVKRHSTHIYQKLGVKNRLQAALLAEKQRISPLGLVALSIS